MKSIHFQAIVREVEHPYLHKFLCNKKERGKTKKFVCDAAERELERVEKGNQEEKEERRQEAQRIAEIQKSLDEIKTILKSGVVLQEHEEQIVKESSRISDALSKLSFGGL